MNTTFTRRSFGALALGSALFATRAAAQDHDHGHGDDDSTPESFSCAVALGTPEIERVESDIPFDLAYIDTMIPHHNSVIALAEHAIDDIERDDLKAIAQAILDTQPAEVEKMEGWKAEWYPDAPEEPDHDTMMEMMAITMGGVENCDDEHHMNLMDSEWIVEEYDDADDDEKQEAFIKLVVPHHQMAVHQSVVAREFAEHQELKDMVEEVIEAQNAEIEELRRIRRELEGL